MKIPPVFLLTKREQRVVAVIVLVLLLMAIAKHYQFVRSHPDSHLTTTTPPIASPAEDEGEAPDESP
jgi:hypothetical protein